MAQYNFASVVGAKSLAEVIDSVENMRKEVEYLFNSIDGDNFVEGTLNMGNKNIDNVNHIFINDVGEGIEWKDPTNNWKIIVSPDDGSNATGPFQFFNNGVRMATVGTTGNVYATGDKFRIQKATGFFEADNTACLNSSTGGFLSVGSDGTDRVWSGTIYARTYTSGTAAVQITSLGTLGILSSAQRYKLDIQDVPTEMPDKILNLSPRMWYDKTASEMYADYLTKISLTKPDGTPNEVQDIPIPDFPEIERSFGLIAEEVEAAGLSEFVVYSKDENGNKQTQSIMYERMWMLLLPIIKKLEQRVTVLEGAV